jgi:hypothetical protein
MIGLKDQHVLAAVNIDDPDLRTCFRAERTQSAAR